MLSEHTIPEWQRKRWAYEDVAYIEFERMKALGASDRLALDSAIRAFERIRAALEMSQGCSRRAR